MKLKLGHGDVLVLYVPSDQKEEGVFWFCMSPRPKGGRGVLVVYVPEDQKEEGIFWFCLFPQTKRRKGCFGFVCPPDRKEEGMLCFLCGSYPRRSFPAHYFRNSMLLLTNLPR